MDQPTSPGPRSRRPEPGDRTWTQRVGAFTELPTLLRQLGGDPVAALAGVGLAPDALDRPEARLPYGALARLLADAAERTDCAHFGLLAGRAWHLADLGLMGEVMRNSPTLGDALRTFTEYQHVNSGGGLAYLMEHPLSVDFGYAIYFPGTEGAEQMCDVALAAGFNLVREIGGSDWLPTDVFLPRSPPDDVQHYRNLFKVLPHFNAEYCALRFPAHWMTRPVKGADSARLTAAMREADSVPIEFVQAVYRALRRLLLAGRHSGDAVADALSIHRRTLNRRLKAEGTTFQQVLDRVRFEVACQLLATSDVALDDIAATLGYAGVSPFMRTFRRWSGTTPGRWRHRARRQDNGSGRGQDEDDAHRSDGESHEGTGGPVDR
jgi:AraC-like DNA-binding protein